VIEPGTQVTIIQVDGTTLKKQNQQKRWVPAQS
jgi:hypothetical protein